MIFFTQSRNTFSLTDLCRKSYSLLQIFFGKTMPFRNAPHQLPQRKTKKAHPKAGFSISKLTESYSPFPALQMLILAAPELQILGYFIWYELSASVKRGAEGYTTSAIRTATKFPLAGNGESFRISNAHVRFNRIIASPTEPECHPSQDAQMHRTRDS